MVAAIRTVMVRPTSTAHAAPLPAATNSEYGTTATATLGAAAARPCAKTPQKPMASRSRPVSSAAVTEPNATSGRTGVDMMFSFLRVVSQLDVEPSGAQFDTVD